MKAYFTLVLLACIGCVFTATIDRELLRELIDDLEGLNRRQSSPTKIIVQGLPFRADEADLERLFGKYGEITYCAIIRDRDGLSRGYGMVTFKNRGDAEKAVEDMDYRRYEGRTLLVYIARPRPY